MLAGNLGTDGPGGIRDRPGGTANIFISTPRAPGQTGGVNGGMKTGEIGGPGAGDIPGVRGCIGPGGGMPRCPKGDPITGSGMPTCWLSLPFGLTLPPFPTLFPFIPCGPALLKNPDSWFPY
ncbi:hypothetical protein L6164_006024 [Bauhinia variegata]|uniref:Uncharacterized protein n=1 Tax=Bauhinia variegata TaxID=167791 RepID=A0ACB9PS99_BAUVA|nr:hypothetical protein L6164_006024 [Bauhinia variegata]